MQLPTAAACSHCAARVSTRAARNPGNAPVAIAAFPQQLKIPLRHRKIQRISRLVQRPRRIPAHRLKLNPVAEKRSRLLHPARRQPVQRIQHPRANSSAKETPSSPAKHTAAPPPEPARASSHTPPAHPGSVESQQRHHRPRPLQIPRRQQLPDVGLVHPALVEAVRRPAPARVRHMLEVILQQHRRQRRAQSARRRAREAPQSSRRAAEPPPPPPSPGTRRPAPPS